jgi:predicted outer membrane repeat protein
MMDERGGLAFIVGLVEYCRTVGDTVSSAETWEDDQMRWIVYLLVICMIATVSVAKATIRHVPSEYQTIRAGIDAAVDGDTVLVADGTYTGDGNRDIDLLGKAIRVSSENGPELTIIDCDGSESDPHRGFIFHSFEDSNSVVQGFTIKNGYVMDTGGGIYSAWRCSPTIVGNIIIGNRAYYEGGGVWCSYDPAVIRRNVIRGNTASWGGGINCWDTWPATREETDARDYENHEGRVASLNVWGARIEGNIITGNTADLGGGISFEGFMGSYPAIEGNIIVGNRADYGGGIHCSYLSSPIIWSNTIAGNTASNGGGGICCVGDVSPTVLNSILWADSAGTGQEIYVTGSVSITYSDIEGGWEGEGNIDADPLFVLPEQRDYRLLWGSPCIDSGHPDSLDPDGTHCDMGAFPFDQSHPLTIYLTPDTTAIPRPGELGVTYTLINIEPDPWTFWLRSDVTLPNGKPYQGNPIIGPQKITLPGEKDIQKYLTHPVPGNASLGIYTYKSRIGLPPDQLIDKDIFEFEVVE